MEMKMSWIALDRIRFKWKGTWSTDSSYTKDDIIYYEGKAYVCLEGHTSSATDFYNDRDTAPDQTIVVTVGTDTLNSRTHGVFYLDGIESPGNINWKDILTDKKGLLDKEIIEKVFADDEFGIKAGFIIDNAGSGTDINDYIEQIAEYVEIAATIKFLIDDIQQITNNIYL
jgi:hypothetical protein